MPPIPSMPPIPHTPSRPAALLSLWARAVRQVPGVSLTEREVQRVERVLLRQLRDRMDAAGDAPEQPLAAPVGEPSADRPVDTGPAGLLAGLLHDSVEQTMPQARTRLHRWLLQQLLPDQARILAALSDGTPYPVVHVTLRGPIGGTGEKVLENASTVGRAAGVALPDQVPVYVAHLRSLGLVAVGPEDESLREAYDIAETDPTVRAAMDRADGAVRTTRRTLRLSALGRDLWSACQADMTDES